MCEGFDVWNLVLGRTYKGFFETLDADIDLEEYEDDGYFTMDDITAFIADEIGDDADEIGGRLPVASGNCGENYILLLREGIERYMSEDVNDPEKGVVAQSQLPIMWDFVDSDSDFSHKPGGANVLYMDGHVEWQPYPGKTLPTTKANALIGRNW